jgi:DNA-binding NarL/FixJ family response regulator
MRAAAGAGKTATNEPGTNQPDKRSKFVEATKPTGNTSLRVLVADHQALVRAGICELVKMAPDVEVVAEADNGRQVLRLISSHDPDVVIMDVDLLEMNGLETTVLAKQNFPDVKILLLSLHASEQLVSRAFRNGAEGFVLKNDSVAELQTALKWVAQGARYLSPNVNQMTFVTRLESPDDVLSSKLTPRQRVILKLIADGKSTKEIATLLKISVNTAKTHRLKLMEKLGVHEIAGVVRVAVKLGLVKN